jgi:hypothetical protein
MHARPLVRVHAEQPSDVVQQEHQVAMNFVQ